MTTQSISDVHCLIAEWIRANGVNKYWTLDIFRHLTTVGVPPGDAIDAMERFVDEAIEARGK